MLGTIVLPIRVIVNGEPSRCITMSDGVECWRRVIMIDVLERVWGYCLDYKSDRPH